MTKIKNIIRKFNAFTLAEVLITLTIIGVVASITVPTLSRNATNHTTITTLKSTYSILSQAIHRAQADYGDASEWTTERWTEQGAIDIAEKLKPYLKIAKDCGTYDEKMECLNYEHVVQKNGIISEIDLPKDRRYYKFVLNNGVLVRLKATDTGEHANGSAFVFFVDVNGYAKPNKVSVDNFSFSFENNKLIPWGSPTSHYPYERECLPKTASGYGCAYYVLTTGKMDY